MTLQEFFAENPKVALGFSGGVDSAYLLYEAQKAGAEVGAYYVKTPFQPEFEYADASRLAQQLGIALRVIHLDVLDAAQVAENPWNRCYYCKKMLFEALKAQALLDGFSVLLDGTNASDSDADRPGIQALRELAVLSPLRLCGLTKGEIRQRSREAGLFTWDKPAYACLATRIPTGTPITRQDLHRVEQGEDFLHQLGFRDFRVRLLGDAAKIQLRQEQMALALEKRQQILAAFCQWFDQVYLDLKER